MAHPPSETNPGQTALHARDELEPPVSGLFALVVRIRTFRALQYREFRYLWLGQWATAMATWMDQVARGWLIYELTDSAIQLGLIRAIQAVPFFFLSPLAGAVADRYDRRAQLIISQVLDAAFLGGLAVLVLTGVVETWHVYVTAIATATVQVFQQPPRQALVSDSVPESTLINAIGLTSMTFNASRTLGPALAGVLIALVGTGGSFVAQALMYGLATLCTLPIHDRAASRTARHAGRLTLRAVINSNAEGWRFVERTDAVKVGMLVAMTAALLAVPFTTLLPVFARDILQAGPTGQGFLLTAMGIGALCSATLIASLGDRMPRVAFMLAGVSLYGIAIAAFGASSSFHLSLLLMLVAGLFHVSSHALIQTVIQAYSPSELRGRMMALFQQSQVINTVGGMLAGLLATMWSAPWAIGSMGLMCTVCVVGIATSFPRARFIR